MLSKTFTSLSFAVLLASQGVSAATISFLGAGTNVDVVLPNAGPTNLNTRSFTADGGGLEVRSIPLLTSRNLSQTGTRGLGVVGGRDGDEVDTTLRNGTERLEVAVLNGAYTVSSIELRSLFQLTLPILGSVQEQARIVISDGVNTTSQDLFGTESTLGGGNGIQTLTFNTPLAFTSIQFFVPTGLSQAYSEFSLASLTVERLQDDPEVPEPGSLLLLGGGLTALVAYRRLRR